MFIAVEGLKAPLPAGWKAVLVVNSSLFACIHVVTICDFSVSICIYVGMYACTYVCELMCCVL